MIARRGIEFILIAAVYITGRSKKKTEEKFTELTMYVGELIKLV